jgi:hypothetical protein
MNRLLALSSLLLLVGCSYNTIQDPELTPETAQAFQRSVKLIRVRVWNVRSTRATSYESDPAIVATVERELRAKGYEVECVQADPWDYGARDDARPGYVGYIHQLLDQRYLGPSTAFIEVAYGIQVNYENRVQNQTNRYETTDGTVDRNVEEHFTLEHPKALADAEVFFGGLNPIYGRFVSCPESRDVEDVTCRALDGVPDAGRSDAPK